MAPTSLDELLEGSLAFLDKLLRILSSEAETSSSPRVQLLAAALAQQQQALIDTVERIHDRQSARTLARRLPEADGEIKPPPPPPVPCDSRALTAWLLEATQALAERFSALMTKTRLGPAADAVEETQRLLLAYCRRVALESQRFEDL